MHLQGLFDNEIITQNGYSRLGKFKEAADLKNIRVVKRDALDTGLDAATINIPFEDTDRIQQSSYFFIEIFRHERKPRVSL